MGKSILSGKDGQIQQMNDQMDGLVGSPKSLLSIEGVQRRRVYV